MKERENLYAIVLQNQIEKHRKAIENMSTEIAHLIREKEAIERERVVAAPHFGMVPTLPIPSE